MLMASISLTPLSAVDTSTSQVQALQKQIEVLQTQLEMLAKQVKEQSTQVKEIKTENKQIKEHRAVMATPGAKESLNAPVFEKGYFHVPETNTGVQFYGMVKLDAMRDGKNSAGDYVLMSNVPYNLQARNPNVPNAPNAYTWKKHFNMHAKQSLFGFRVLTKTTSGKDIKANIELDMLGSPAFGDSYPTYSAGGMTAGQTTSLTYQPRIRFATVSYGGLMVGHTWTNFYDMLETIMPTIDYQTLQGPGRRAQVRYTHNFGSLAAAVSAELPRADYVTYSNSPAAGTYNYVYYGQSTGGNLAKPQRPDLTASLKYTFVNGNMLGVSAITRDLTIKNNGSTAAAADGRIYKANGYGFNIAGKIMTLGKSYVTAGYQFGKGIGWYINDLQGRSALFDISNSAANNRTYKAIPMQVAWLGYTHVWSDQWKSSVGGSKFLLDTGNSTFNRGTSQWFDPGLDRSMSRLCFNTIYSPEENLSFGVEFMYAQRKSVLNYKGEINRYQFGAWYKF